MAQVPEEGLMELIHLQKQREKEAAYYENGYPREFASHAVVIELYDCKDDKFVFTKETGIPTAKQLFHKDMENYCDLKGKLGLDLLPDVPFIQTYYVDIFQHLYNLLRFDFHNDISKKGRAVFKFGELLKMEIDRNYDTFAIHHIKDTMIGSIEEYIRCQGHMPHIRAMWRIVFGDDKIKF